MKKLIWNLLLPMTVIFIAVFTKWWYVLPVDAPDTMMSGFPLIYLSDGWHTSMSLQIFITEFIVDFLIYFLSLFFIVFCINRYLIKIKVHKLLSMTLYGISGLIAIGTILIASNSDNLFYLKRDFDIQILDSGFKYNWTHTTRPVLQDYVLVQEDYKKNVSIDWENLFYTDNFSINYVQNSSNPFLGGDYRTKRIQNVNFIDSIKIVDKANTKILIAFIKDPNNFKKGNTEPYPFIINSGFIFRKTDTLIGSINMTYDYKHIEFEPEYKNETSWELTNEGLEKITLILKEVAPNKK